MKSFRKRIQTACLLLFLPFLHLHSQLLTGVEIAGTGMSIGKLIVNDSSVINLARNKPFFSFKAGNKIHYSSESDITRTEEGLAQSYGTIKVLSIIKNLPGNALQGEISFDNAGTDTVSISNVVPFGFDSLSCIHITGRGPWDLARAWLFRPGYRPLRVILPDNAWEMGYTSFAANENISVCAIARRSKVLNGAQRQRYETILPPGAKVIYNMYAETFRGEWQNGLRLMFRDRYLHDIEKFDNTLYERDDLKWIKEAYIIILQMAWDREFYDRTTGKYNYADFLKKSAAQFGKLDIFCIWPTWPRLGLDQRNQWDLYRDLPGGIKQLSAFVKLSQQTGTRFFIAYNPWDKSTRAEDHMKGMAEIISQTGSDGVVLDTQGASSRELQAAADSVKKGVIMYSEGMAVTRDMPGIISGRVHNAIYYSPELNLNKLIKPDFAIFRVCDVGEDLIHRELAIAFFNGYGTELNMSRPGGRDDDYRDDMNYLARTTMTLRQNNDAFLDNDWTPLIPTIKDDVFVNKWNSGDKTIYTVLNMRQEGFDGKLFTAELKSGRHWVSLWNHSEIIPVKEKSQEFITAKAGGWYISDKGTRREASVDCLAELPDLIHAVITDDSIKLNSTGTGKILLWKGNPSYQIQPKELRIVNDTTLRLRDLFGIYEGKIVLQLTENNLLKDERVLNMEGGKPWKVSRFSRTAPVKTIPSDMVMIPGSKLSFKVTAGDEFIPYPEINGKTISIDSFLIDRYPVTNEQYYEFLTASGYRPSDTTRFLRHWVSGIYKLGQEKYPVVNLSLEDMMAYANWAGKRLPTEAEWQLAAQGTDGRLWPWGNEFHGAVCNNSFGRSSPVDAFPKGQSPYGAMDMVGNVWQMTSDMYFNGINYFTIIRGGSYYKPESSWWYVQGGPQQLDKSQMLLMVSPGFDRSSTLGFRCVKDIDKNNFQVNK